METPGEGSAIAPAKPAIPAVADLFAATFLPAAAEAGVLLPTISRHLPILRRCVGPRDGAVLVARCTRPQHPLGGGRSHLLLLTPRRLVVTVESRLRRLRLHLNSELHHLTNVTWTTEPALGGIHLSATAVDGVREHFWIKVVDRRLIARWDASLHQVFRPTGTPASAVPTERPVHISNLYLTAV
jgi:hypothetical protein